MDKEFPSHTSPEVETDDDDEEESTSGASALFGRIAVEKPKRESEPRREAPPKENKGELEPEQVPEAKKMLVDASRAENAAHPIAAESPSAAELGDKYVDQLHELSKADDGEGFTEPYEKAKAMLIEQGVDPEDIAEAEADSSTAPEVISEVSEDAAEAEPDPDHDATVESDFGFGDDEVMFDRAAEALPADAEADEEDDLLAATPTTTTGPTGSTTTSGSGTTAPPPPSPPTPPFGPTRGGPINPFGGFNHNAAMPIPVPNPNVAPANPMEHIDDGGNAAGAALLGGIIGYFIGRRRGRIKAEKQAKKVEKRLTKQIENMHWDLKDKEAKLRRIAAQQVKKNGSVAAEQFTVQPIAEKQPVRTELVAASIIGERPQNEIRRRAPEAHHLHGSPRASEQIGQVLIAAEAAIIAGTRTEKIVAAKPMEASQAELPRSIKQAEQLKLAPEKHVETMNRAELLSLSEKIIVDGSSLRQIYETHLIGEHGLRRLVAEHLRGGDLKKALRQEVVEREIDFERDPAMRDTAPTAGPVATGGGTAVLDRLVEKAAAHVASGTNEEAAFYKARTHYEVKQHEQEQKQRRMVDIALSAVIITLVALVTMMYLSHH